jgi:high frequency lysogenization protein
MSTQTTQLAPLEQRALALAGLMQSTVFVEKCAFSQEIPEEALTRLFESLYTTKPQDFSDIIPNLDDLLIGITYLRGVLQRRPSDSDNRILGYALNVMQLEKKLRGRSDMINKISTRIAEMQAQYETQEDRLQPNAIAELSELYRTTLSELRPHIEVKGKPDCIRKSANAAKIRSLLLAGIRFAMLWHQLGGRRWHLVLRQRQIVANLNQLYDRLSSAQLLH